MFNEERKIASNNSTYLARGFSSQTPETGSHRDSCEKPLNDYLLVMLENLPELFRLTAPGKMIKS
jgi:hypothetical protein